MKRIALLAGCLIGLITLAARTGEPDLPAEPERVGPYARWQSGPPARDDFFPVGVWLQQPKNAAAYKAAGFNLYIGLWQGPTAEQLADLKKAGMPVICSQNKVGLADPNRDIIVGWLQQDEPDNAQLVSRQPRRYGGPVPPASVVERYEKLRRADATRPVLLNLGQGVANDEWKGRGRGAKQDDYLTYVKGCDVVSFDVYPVVGIGKPDGENFLWYTARGVQRLRKWSGRDKLIWHFVECTHISDPDRKATPAQVKAEVWMGIVHGSRGVMYFVHQFKPKFVEAALLADKPMLKAVTAINAQLHALAPVLNSPTVADDAAATVASAEKDAPIATMTKHHGGATYVFAVGMRNAKTTGRFTVPGAGDGNVEVIDEGRSVTMKVGVFTDTFEPYAVHLYRLADTKGN